MQSVNLKSGVLHVSWQALSFNSSSLSKDVISSFLAAPSRDDMEQSLIIASPQISVLLFFEYRSRIWGGCDLTCTLWRYSSNLTWTPADNKAEHMKVSTGPHGQFPHYDWTVYAHGVYKSSWNKLFFLSTFHFLSGVKCTRLHHKEIPRIYTAQRVQEAAWLDFLRWYEIIQIGW